MASVSKGLGKHVALLVGESGVLREKAEEIAAIARSEAAKHSDTGAFAASIRVIEDRHSSGVKDAVVVADNAAIETGHVARDGKTWVPGKHILLKARKRAENEGR